MIIGLGIGIPFIHNYAYSTFQPFDPSTLFANGEPGAWYDPSDLTTLFQDAAGTTPVTAVEQPVGLMLDKSKGLVLGPELVTNGAFDMDTAWTKVHGAVISEGAANIPATGYIFQVKNLQQGKFYLVKATISNYVVGSGQHVQYRYDYGGATTRTIFSISRNGSFSGVLNIDYAPSGQGVFVESQSGSFTIDNISVRELPGNHAFQTTATSRPVLKQDAGGQYYLKADGIDDWMVTSTITPGTDKAQVFAGVRKLSDTVGYGVVAELVGSSVTGSWTLHAPGLPNVGSYLFASRGAISRSAEVASGYPAPITNVVSGLGDISGDLATLRVNGTQAAQSTADQGPGNYLAYPLYLFRRGGTSFPFNGHFYGGIIRFGPNLPIETIEQTEAWMAAKTGVTLPVATFDFITTDSGDQVVTDAGDAVVTDTYYI